MRVATSPWFRAVYVAEKINKGHFPGSISLAPTAWPELLDPLHETALAHTRHMTEWLRAFGSLNYFEYLDQHRKPSERQRAEYLNRSEVDACRVDLSDGRLYLPAIYSARFKNAVIAAATKAPQADVVDDGKWVMFVACEDTIYVCAKLDRRYFHTSFGGMPVWCAGNLHLADFRAADSSCRIDIIANDSGHYEPGLQSLARFLWVIQLLVPLAAVDVLLEAWSPARRRLNAQAFLDANLPPAIEGLPRIQPPTLTPASTSARTPAAVPPAAPARRRCQCCGCVIM